MKKTAFYALVFVSLVAGAEIAQARIGETEAQIKARYGEMSDSQHSGYGIMTGNYWLNNFQITVYFLRGKSYKEVYTHAEDEPLTDAEIEALLKANASGGKWERKKHSSRFELEWEITKDNVVIAIARSRENRKELTVVQRFSDDMSGF